MEKFCIKPKFPYIFLIAILFFTTVGIILVSTKYSTFTLIIVAFVPFFSGAVMFVWLIESSYSKITGIGDFIFIDGFFGIRKIAVRKSEVKGYEIQDRLDQVNGIVLVWFLVLNSGKKVRFPPIAYSNYDEIINWLEGDFPLLERKKIKNSELHGRIFVYMSIIASILTFAVGIMKLINYLNN